MKNEESLSVELDLLPEHKHYMDEGCDMSPSCLSCPLENCIYDTPHGKQTELKRRRNDEILRVFREEHPSLGELARMFKVSMRTVQRALKGGKVKIKRKHKETKRGDIHT
jgi:predicted HTH domain antitoxin